MGALCVLASGGTILDLPDLVRTLVIGMTVCGAVFLLADWRRIPRRLFEAGPWILLVTLASAWVSVVLWDQLESHLRNARPFASPEQRQFLELKPWILIARSVIELVGTAVLACAGLAACRHLGRRGLRWSRRWPDEHAPTRSARARWLGETATLVGGAVAWSFLVHIVLGRPVEARHLTGAINPLWMSGAVSALVIAPIAEELKYRLGVQGLLERMIGVRWALPASVVMTAVLWTLAHPGSAVRYAQIFPIGVALGCLRVRNGAEAGIAAHAVLNAAMMALSPVLASG